MGRYLLVRLALMPVTLVLALLVLFVIVNLAPGSAGDFDDPREAASRRESQRVFREQFGLDRPILLDTRRWTSADDVRALLDAGARGEQALDDLGTYAVGPLTEIARTDGATRAALAQAQLARLVPGVAEAPERSLLAVLTETRFARFWENVLRLDFGRSLVDRTPVLPAIVARLRVSVTLGLASILLAYALAIPIGIFSAARAGTRADRALTGALFALYAAPSFFVGTLLLELLATGHPLRLFPPGGFATLDAAPGTALDDARDVAHHLVLPIATYTAAVLAALSRYARAGVAEVLRADHVRTARAKGLPELVVLVRHVARNGMIPVLTLLGGLLPALVSGSVVIEVVFGVPGVGLYLYDAINLRDYNAIMGVLVIVSAATIVGTFASDVAVALADPRIRLERAR